MPPTDRNYFFNQVFRDAQEAACCRSESLKEMIKVLANNARKYPDDRERVLGWQFAQFIVGAIGATSAIRRYELNEAGDWLAWSLTESIEESTQQHMVEVGREFRIPTVTV